MRVPQFHIIALVAWLFLSPIICGANPVVAPRCELVSLATHFKDARVVFSGEVINIRRTDGFSELRFRVLRSWKNARDSEITLAANPADPEIVDFAKGRRYLVFATMFQGRLFAGGCSGTAELADARDEIRLLRKWSHRRSR